MTQALIVPGDKFHIMTRRLFDDDLRRHFVGEVVAASGGLAELSGYTFIFQSGPNEYRKLPELRTRLFSLGQAGHIVNKIPREVDLESIGYSLVARRLIVTDGKSFSLPINEFSATS